MRFLLLFLSLILCLIACNNAKTDTKKETDNKDWPLLPFVKADEVNPVLVPSASAVFNCPVRKTTVKWEEKDVFNPAAVVRNDTVFLLYRAEDVIGKFAGTSRIGIAWSTDGLHFTKHPVPVLYPDNDSLKKYEWEGGCEDPRIVEDESGVYYLTYTAYDGNNARLLIATSTDLYHWKKRGHVFAQYGSPEYINGWSKSGSIVCRYQNGKALATKINGKYWMYWGDTNIFIATSDDLINWIPAPSEQGTGPAVLFGPRPKKFDSDLVEPGPPAMLTDNGIVLIYNSRNIRSKGDTSLANESYNVSQILMDKNSPFKVAARMDSAFMKADRAYEINGQVHDVCFVEGLVNYKSKWFLYYGTADSKIAVAVK
jgi:predicted GH43/DUF377 family glycosyl hydrolase